MKLIPNKFKQTGLTATLVRRTEKTALYTLTGEYGNHNGFEIHRIRHDAPKRISFGGSLGAPGKVYDRPESERLASAGEFGLWAWSAFTREQADKLFDLVDSPRTPGQIRQEYHSSIPVH
jgi:hypothetical protein